MKAKFTNVDPTVLAAYRKMVSAVDGVEVKGATAPYTSVNGNMFSSVNKEHCIGLRLSADDREAFLKKHKTTLFEALPGFFQKEYVAVPKSLLANTRTLKSYFKKSYEYAVGLKAKPTTRKKKVAKKPASTKNAASTKKAQKRKPK